MGRDKTKLRGQFVPAGCIAQYKMASGASNSGKLQDHTHNGNQGTITNAVYDGADGLKFDGVGDFVNCGNDPSLDVTNLSVEVWAKLNTEGNWSFVSRSNTNKAIWDLNIAAAPGNELQVVIGSADGTAVAVQATISASLVVATWYHFGFVFTDGVGVTGVYIDGVSKSFADAQTYTALNQSDNDVDLILGAKNAGTGFILDGWIRKLRIYKTALTALDFKMLYEQGAF